ncbi:hypothetical protein IHE49_03525 [Rhodanobacter sp. 7MK24]|uniref:endonuclease/exonuclease/phosphatase family protein n=1 Tax=Rhodanobacter sp. 7MK24 TaxID=2775922 RepID=UPI00177FF11D|nr:endonuclease/exonuclease/phosphatase family protein [Rhodanobacter sp. 7MK24]MBD8879547.1 hypothetical protein [Rhodanobacter sp. 7MK24]
MRIAYQNLQRLGNNSDPAKRANIIKDLRNFSVWWPDYYCFVEFGTSNGDQEFRAFGRDLFASTGRLSKDWGCEYDYCDPHKQGVNNHRGDETFAVFKADKSAANQIRMQNTLTYLEAFRTIDAGLRQVRETFGTRQLARMTIQNAAQNDSFDLLLAHPSPMNASQAMITLLDFINEQYVAQRRKFLLVGDFNYRPDQQMSTVGKESIKSIAKALNSAVGDGGLLAMFNFFSKTRSVMDSVSVREIAKFRKFSVANSGSDTHANMGEIDYVLHSADLQVSKPGVLTRSQPGSDHHALYFDVTWT